MLTQIPHGIECGIGGLKVCRLIVKGHMHGDLPHGIGIDIGGMFDLGIAKWNDLTDGFRHGDGRQ